MTSESSSQNNHNSSSFMSRNSIFKFFADLNKNNRSDFNEILPFELSQSFVYEEAKNAQRRNCEQIPELVLESSRINKKLEEIDEIFQIQSQETSNMGNMLSLNNLMEVQGAPRDLKSA
mmetsp:Transcript_31060/g.47449  ORF Transcript_31060/g.47449 Transcript_31060/m.47449 type:complete len:119 (-) Transcript_31060:228-584(-)